MSDRDYYEILGLTPRADGQMVDQAYWHLVRKYQALAVTNSRAQRMIDDLNEAYGVIGNPRLRAQYDAFRDDVLIRSGMLKPVTSKPKREKKAGKPAEPKQARQWRLPSIRIPNARTYSVSGVIALVAFAAAWQGVNIVAVALLLVVGLGVSLAPMLGRHMSDFSFEMPSVPEIKAPRAPRISLPSIDVPSLREIAPIGQEGVDADTLRRSTAETIARWRQSVGLKVSEAEPSGDGVDELEQQAASADPSENEDPFDTVMDILRGSSKRATPG